MHVQFRRSILVLFTVTIGLAGQAGSRSGSAGSSTPPSSVGRNPTTTSPTTTQPNTTTQPDLQRPMYLSGKVVMNDGTPPPESVTIQLACTGSPRSIGFSDSKGRFSIDLSNSRANSAIYADASQNGMGRFGSNPGNQQARTMGPSNTGVMGLAGCDLMAALAGFRSDRVNLSNRHSLDNPDVGTIILHRLGNVEGLTISATSAMAPKDARKAFEKGLNEAKKAKWDNAEREFQKAVDSYPKYAAAWYQLGLAQEQLKQPDDARKSFAKSLECDSKFVTPRLQLAIMAARENKWDEVATSTSEILRLNPVDFPQAWYFNSLANFQLKKMDLAEKSASGGLTADTAHTLPRLDLILAVILANKGEYTGASEHFKNYLKLAPEANDAEQVKKQLAQVEQAAAEKK